MYVPQLPMGRRTGFFKRPGIPKLAAKTPRGLMICLPFAAEDFTELTRSWPHDYWANLLGIGYTPFGGGFKCSASSNIFTFRLYGSQPPTRWSLEVLVYLGAVPSTDIGIAGWSSYPIGLPSAFDRVIGINSSGQFLQYSNPGPLQTISTFVATAGSCYHVVATNDASTATIYVNGVSTSQSSGGASHTGYSDPYFVVGDIPCNNAFGGQGSITGTLLLVNFAAAAWTAAEVATRFANPFEFLIFPEDVVAAKLSSLPRSPYPSVWLITA